MESRSHVRRDRINLTAWIKSHIAFAKRTPHLLTTGIFLLSVLATFVLWRNAELEVENDLRTEFNFQVRQTTRRIEQRMATYEQVMRGTQAHLLGSITVGYSDFHAYVEALRLNEKFPGIQGIAIAEIVPKSALEEHINSVRHQGVPDYTIRPSGDRDVYSSITHIEPFGGLNLRALGFDMLSEPVRRAAMEKSRDAGQAIASGKVKLVQETGENPQAGIVMYLPVYKRNAPVSTVEERRANILGWVGAPFRMDDLMAGLGGERSNDILLSIYDSDTISDNTRLYRSADLPSVSPMFSEERHIVIAGQPWVLVIRSSPNFDKLANVGKPHVIAIAGLGVSILLAILVYVLATGRRRAVVLATAMTHQLQESEFRWKYALEGAGDGLWDWDNATDDIVYSKRWKEMLGYTDAEITNSLSEWERLLHPEDASRVRAAMSAYLNGEQQAYAAEFRMRCKDGSWKWILARAMAASRDAHGNVLRTIGTHTDITRTKLDEHALREVNARLAAEQQRVRVILQNSHDAFVAIDSDNRITEWNAKAEITFGWSAGEAIGKELADLIIPAEFREAHRMGLRRFITTGKSTIINNVVEVNAVHRSGRLIPVELAVAGFQEESGYAVSAFIRDISERKQAQRMEAERTQALEETRQALQHAQKLEAVGKLTGGVAHDFNNVLQVVKGSLQLLDVENADNPKMQKRTAIAMSAVDRGAKLSAQLLAFARKQPLQPRPTNLARVIRIMDELLQRAIGESIAFETIVAGGLWNTFIDPNQLEHVILNLALNARDAMQGNGKLTIEISNTELDEEYVKLEPGLKAGEFVMLAISDTGSGMSPEHIERAFEPFFTTKPEGEGTGLGLSMAYGFVKQSEGHIRIYSEVGHGTTVRIYLPRSFENEEEKPPPAIEGVEGGSETILAVEDDPAVQATVVDMLSGLGYKTLKADNAMQARDLLASGAQVDLLFTDVVMPGPLKSPELAKHAKLLLPDLQILFTSGYTQNAINRDGRLDPGVHLLSKPYNRQQMARKIRELLNSKQHPAQDVDAAVLSPAPAVLADAAKTDIGNPTGLHIAFVEDNVDFRMLASEMLSMIGHQVESFGCAEQAQAPLMTGSFDVLVTDINLPGMSGVELARSVTRTNSKIRIILASGYGNYIDEEVDFPFKVLSKPFTLEQLKTSLTVDDQ